MVGCAGVWLSRRRPLLVPHPAGAKVGLSDDCQGQDAQRHVDQLTYENRQKRQGHVVSLDACLEAGSRLYDLLPDSTGADEQVIFEMLVCSMASGLSGTEKAVLRLSTEGCSEREISKELGIPPKQVKEALAALRRRCTEEQIVEAV